MPTEDEYKRRIRRMGRSGLISLLKKIDAGGATGWEPGKAFEYLVLRAFELEGAEIRYPFDVWMEDNVLEQIDGVIYAAGISAIVESKDHGDSVNVESIAKMRNQLLRRPSLAIGIVFSRSGFTDPAKILAHFTASQTILLWDGDEVRAMLARRKMIQGLKTKLNFAIEHGNSDYSLTLGVSK